MKIAVITARGGSKRIPRKNIKEFCGKPIIAYSIHSALNSGCFDEVMVSTDDAEIAEIAIQYGAKIPFMRSAETATDHATTAAVILEVIQSYQQHGIFPSHLCCIYPTAPLVSSGSIREGLSILEKNPTVKTAFPITRFSYPIQRALKLQDGKIAMFHPEYLLTRSQDLEPAYQDAGQFYWVRIQDFLLDPSLYSTETAGILLPEWQVQDIDNEDDWILAEMKYQFMQLHKMEIKNEIV